MMDQTMGSDGSRHDRDAPQDAALCLSAWVRWFSLLSWAIEAKAWAPVSRTWN